MVLTLRWQLTVALPLTMASKLVHWRRRFLRRQVLYQLWRKKSRQSSRNSDFQWEIRISARKPCLSTNRRLTQCARHSSRQENLTKNRSKSSKGAWVNQRKTWRDHRHKESLLNHSTYQQSKDHLKGKDKMKMKDVAKTRLIITEFSKQRPCHPTSSLKLRKRVQMLRIGRPSSWNSI